MLDIIDFNKIVFDSGTWIAIIAINMTIIGLTSLAETKKIIGVDYGKYLIKSYKIFNSIRIYYLLVIFATINVVSLISMFITLKSIRTVNFIVLLISLIFAIYYFFSFILVENPRVKKQIYRTELLGMYYNSDDVTSFRADLITKMSNGWRTNKRLSTNVITYFNVFNNESQIAFQEIFGPKSLIYDESKKNKKYWKNEFNLEPYNYKSESGLVHISHEFFQLYRYSELQEKWILEILRLFNIEYSKDNNEVKLDNLIRVIAHINRFGKNENLFKYKFLEYLTPYIYDALDCSKPTTAINYENRIKKEEFFFEQLYSYIVNTISRYEEESFYKAAINLCDKLILQEYFAGFMDIHRRVDKLFELVKYEKNEKVRDFATELFNSYNNQSLPDKRSVQDIVTLIQSSEKHVKANKVSKDDLFIN